MKIGGISVPGTGEDDDDGGLVPGLPKLPTINLPTLGEVGDGLRQSVTNPAGQIKQNLGQQVYDILNPSKWVNRNLGLDQGSTKYLDPTAIYDDKEREKEREKRLKEEEDLAAAYAENQAAGNKKLYEIIGGDLESLKAGKEGMVKGLMQPKLRQGRAGIADRLTALKSGFGSRGRLHSGAARKAAAEERTRGAQDLATAEYETRSGVDDTISELEDLYQKAGLNVSGIQAQSDYESQMNALAKRLADMKESQALGQAAGEVGGAYLANRNKETT